MTTTEDRQARTAHFKTNVMSMGGTATYTGAMPDPMLHASAPVAEAWDAYKATLDAAGPLRAELQSAVAARADHLSDPDAVHTRENGTLVFSDPVGVKLQNDVRRLERELAANAQRSKTSLVAYLVEASIVSADNATRQAFHDRMLGAHADVIEHADALVSAIRERERLWGLAGQPIFPDDSLLGEKEAAWLPSLKAQRMAEVSGALGNLEHALATIRPFRAAAD